MRSTISDATFGMLAHLTGLSYPMRHNCCVKSKIISKMLLAWPCQSHSASKTCCRPCSLTYTCIPTHARPATHPPTHSPTHPLTHPPTHPPTHSLARSLTCWATASIIACPTVFHACPLRATACLQCCLTHELARIASCVPLLATQLCSALQGQDLHKLVV